MVVNLGSNLFGVTVLFLITSWIVLLLRCFVRLRIVKMFGPDDWLMAIAVLLFTVIGAVLITSLGFGGDKPLQDYLPSQIVQIVKYHTIGQEVYMIDAIATKFSIGILLLRITPQRRYRYPIFVCMVLLIMTNLAMFFLLVFQCYPVGYYWERFGGRGEGTCLPSESIVSFGYYFSVITVLVDCVFALLPIPMLWGLKMKVQLKISVILILGMGAIASIATIVRLVIVLTSDPSKNIIKSLRTTSLWAIVELGISITAACLATLRPLGEYLHIPGLSSSGCNYTSGQNIIHEGYRAPTSDELRDLRRNSTRVESEPIGKVVESSRRTVSSDSKRF